MSDPLIAAATKTAAGQGPDSGAAQRYIDNAAEERDEYANDYWWRKEYDE